MDTVLRDQHYLMNEAPADERFAVSSMDKQRFSVLVESHRAELLVHCYRMLGSTQDAEDMVQETLLRAWNHLSTFTGVAYFRAWLYKIATNTCLDALEKHERRGLASSTFPQADPHDGIAPPITEPIWLEPFPDGLLPEIALNPEARYTQRESITLAFLAALQLLPPRQRVILILCDVLDWRAKDVAQQLEITVATVNGLLRRARATMNGSYHATESVVTVDHKTRNVLNSYVAAWEAGDVDRLIALLRDKAIFTMPPSPTWFSGREVIRLHVDKVFTQRWLLRETRANDQAAFGSYRYNEHDGIYHAYALQVITLDEGQIAEMQMFLIPSLFPRFELAMTLTP